MMYPRVLTALLCGVALISFPACSDLTGVGAGVGPDSLQGGQATAVDVVPSTIETEETAPRTGLLEGPAPPGGSARQWRFLTGRVDDPVGGTIEAEGFVDFLGSSIPPTSIQNADVDSLEVELRLKRTYVHGDTSKALEIELYDLAEEAEMNGARADTSFATETQSIDSYSVSATDSVLAFSLPQSWINEHASTLQDTSVFEDDFHGFKLAGSTGNAAVVGFEHREADLRVMTSSDTLDYQPLKSFTHTSRISDPSPPENRVVVQDGIARRLVIAWDFDRPALDTLKNTPLTRAEITVPVDTVSLDASLDEAPSSFVRPRVNGYRILATRAENGPECLQVPDARPFPRASDTCILFSNPQWAPAAARTTPRIAYRIFEEALLNTPIFTRLRVEVADRPNPNISPQLTGQRGLPSTLPFLVPTAASEGVDPPHATLTVTPL